MNKPIELPAGNYEVIIIGGSFAGLSAAMSLGRSLRKTLILDCETACNLQTPRSHNFLTRDGQSPQEIIAIAREQLLPYSTVDLAFKKAVNAEINDNGFTIRIEDGTTFLSKKLILATGLKDILPPVQGFSNCWGISVLHCPYCHGYEVKGQLTGIFGKGKAGFGFAKVLHNWTGQLILFTDGDAELDEEQRSMLDEKKIRVDERQIASLEHEDGQLKNIVFYDGEKLEINVLYYSPSFVQQSDIAAKLGCDINEHGLIQVDLFQKTNIPGVYAAGDNSTTGRSIAMAIANGSVAGMLLNKEMIEEEFS